MALALALAVGGARGASYPTRSLELIVPWAAGGGSDRVARFLADALQREFGQPVIVVNRTGGSGAVGHSAGALAAPDGHTLTLATFELSTLRAMGISPLTWR
ncbi:MAG TPA: tripartite tricarboxylate transporter substrate-binding protein, partial [Methylomirabilota bacterium]|nr:tripartite tricarboxylate transporter substrate-binding protein [Methylomirabilota bacterium]